MKSGRIKVIEQTIFIMAAFLFFSITTTGCSSSKAPQKLDVKEISEGIVDADGVNLFRDYIEGRGGRDAGVDIKGDIQPGEPGWPCKSNDECHSGFCLEDYDGYRCAKFCTADQDCGDGYMCAPVQGQSDVIYLCVYKYPKLCLPCKTDLDCKPNNIPGDHLCIAWVPQLDQNGQETGSYEPNYGYTGAFCGTPCKTDADCMSGFECRDVISVDGVKAKQCVKKEKSCGCTDKAKQDQLSGKCFKRNEFGVCEGVFQCSSDGMTQCNAKEPEKEVCNHKDDNCDGQTDEGFDLSSDVNNCGDCGIQCVNPHGTTTCVNGKCVYKCDEGYWDCDGDPTNGCESDLMKVQACGLCQRNEDCPTGFFCKDGDCIKKYTNGHSCNDSAECAGGFCTDEGVCCDQSCDGPCQSCKSGSCVAVEKGKNPEKDDACDGAVCDGNGSCMTKCTTHNDCIASYYCEMTQGDPNFHKCMPDLDLGGDCKDEGLDACKSNFCADGVCCENACDGACRQCNEVGKCVAVVDAEDPDTCSKTARCDDNGECKKLVGQPCAANADCLSGFCVDGACCESACDAPCQECSTGKCLPVMGKDDDPQCSGDHTCDASGQCKVKGGAACEKDEDCADGVCKADFDGTGKWCASINQCVHNGDVYKDGDYASDCWDDKSRAKCNAGKWLSEACEDSACVGDCGQAGCTYNLRGCEDGSCYDRAQDPDMKDSFCTGCGLQWAIGGEVSSDSCCGDDSGEFVVTCKDDSDNGDCGNDTTACCSHQDSCVDDKGQCMVAGECSWFGEKKSYCDGGTWKDPDADKVFCEAKGCDFVWLPDATDNNHCGDDPGEDIVQKEGPGKKCCYNGKVLNSGEADGAILCVNGQLYNCNGAATDDSGIALVAKTCDNLGGLYCNANNVWDEKASVGCGCTHDGDCVSGHCKKDYDGDGAWCAKSLQCVHNGKVYDTGSYAIDCFDDGARAKCNAGKWEADSCGQDDPCNDYYCKAGKCGVNYADTKTLCSVVYKCSPGSGDDKYGIGGNFKCQGYCDGQGHCDFADNCENCQDKNGWYDFGDDGPGCLNKNDPVAEKREYYCSGGKCVFNVVGHKDCNDKDGWYGGGNDPGCGPDPVAKFRDYYVDRNGNCVYTDIECPTKSCDDQDQCGNVCDNDVIKTYKDYYVKPNTNQCVSEYGQDVDNCATKASIDSDGSATAYTKPGVVTDYVDCKNGSCEIKTYRDYCTGNILYEYGASGTGISGPIKKNCKDYESDYCQGGRYLYHDEWACDGDPGYCKNVPTDTLLKDCGMNQCVGDCGSTVNGCMYHLKGCKDKGCFDNAMDPDTKQEYCTGCGLHWAIGGEIASTSCCGDDPNEYALTCKDNSDNGDCGGDTTACCKSKNDCVDHAGVCQVAGMCHAFGLNGKESYCNNGEWEDPDSNPAYCSAEGCGFTWMSNAVGGAKCCGDDPGEDFNEVEGAERPCCYNGKVLLSGHSSGAILCYNGVLYNCNGAAHDDSGVATKKSTCDQVGSLYCTDSGDWSDKKSSGCPCSMNTDCIDGYCKADFDGSGKWCAGNTQCVHNAVVYSNGAYASDCFSGNQRAKCNNGAWVGESCGNSTTCLIHACVSGECQIQYKDTNTQCDDTFRCSTGEGDNNYGAGGNFRCQGYCDGHGHCDYAGNCTDCTANNSTCAQYTCENGTCNPTYADTTTLCNPAFKCSSGQGDNKYGVAGTYKCQGYCDGHGSCDFADNCDDCSDNYTNLHEQGTCSTSNNAGQCQTNGCMMGWGDCNKDSSDGCEEHLDTYLNECAGAVSLDNGLCGDASGCNMAESIGHWHTSLWFKVNLKECDTTNTKDLKLFAYLYVPDGTDYDLYMYSPCGTKLATGFKFTSNGYTYKGILYQVPDDPNNDDSRWVMFEVRYVSANVCDNWYLFVKAGADCF